MSVYYGLLFSSDGAVDRAVDLLAAGGFKFERQPDNVVVAYRDIPSSADAIAQAEAEMRRIANAAGGEYLGKGGLSAMESSG